MQPYNITLCHHMRISCEYVHQSCRFQVSRRCGQSVVETKTFMSRRTGSRSASGRHLQLLIRSFGGNGGDPSAAPGVPIQQLLRKALSLVGLTAFRKPPTAPAPARYFCAPFRSPFRLPFRLPISTPPFHSPTKHKQDRDSK